MTLQFGASLTYDTSSVNYDRNMFIIQATDVAHILKNTMKRLLKKLISNFFFTKLVISFCCYGLVITAAETVGNAIKFVEHFVPIFLSRKRVAFFF